MPQAEYEDIETLSVLRAAKLTKLSRNTISAAMDAWEWSNGKHGLAFIRPTGRRLVRRAALRAWFNSMERSSACA